MNSTKQLDVFSLQIVANYLKYDEDYENIIAVSKKCEYLLDRFRINPIMLTKENKRLFKFIQTQQIFYKNDEDEIKIPDVIYQYNYPIKYKKYLEEKQKFNKCKWIKYSKKDRKEFGETIPPEVNIIGKKCFKNCTFTEFTVPTTIHKIDYEAFQSCTNLTKIAIPDTVYEIGSDCFDHCKRLASIQLPESLKELEYCLFSECKFETFVVPSRITEIHSSVFESCKQLTKVVIENVENIPMCCFRNCNQLKEVVLCDKITSLSSKCFEGCTSLSSIKLPSELKEIEYSAFEECKSLVEIIIPSTVTQIENSCFKNCTNLERLIIENENCFIKNAIIENCNKITELKVPLIDGCCTWKVESKELDVLDQNNISYKEMIMKGMKHKSKDTRNRFVDSDLSYELINGMEKLDDIKYGTTSLYIPTTVTKLKDSYGLGTLKEINIPSSVIKVKKGFFSSVSDENKPTFKVHYDDDRKVIEEKVSYTDYLIYKQNEIECKLVEIYWTDVMESLPTDCQIILLNWAEQNPKLNELPPNVIQLEDFTCFTRDITTLTIPSTVIKIKSYLEKDYFTNLQELKVYKHHKVEQRLFDDITTLTNIEVIDGSIDDIEVYYRYFKERKQRTINFTNVTLTHRQFNNMKLKEIPPEVKTIEQFPEEELKRLNIDKSINIRGYYSENEIVELPSRITTITSEDLSINNCKELDLKYVEELEENAIHWKRHLTSITLGTNLRSMGKECISTVYSLKSINIPSSVTSFGKNVFRGCTLLTSITSDGEVDGKALAKCRSLRQIPVVRSLKANNFKKYSYLTSIILNNDIKTIPTSCFNRCYLLKDITIPTNCEVIQSFAFKDCHNIVEMNIPMSVKQIEPGAFWNCSRLTKITIENKDIEIGYDAFGKCGALKEMMIDGKKMEKYQYEVNYKQMKQFQKIGIECERVVVTREDVIQYGMETINDSRVIRIDDNCFRDNNYITEMIIPTYITSIGMFCFAGCKNLRKIVVPSSIKEIPYCCFDNCVKLFKIQLPEDIVFNQHCFIGCEKLKEKIPNEYIVGVNDDSSSESENNDIENDDDIENEEDGDSDIETIEEDEEDN